MPIHRSRRSVRFGLAAFVGLGLTGAAFAQDLATGREDDAILPIGALVADDELDPRLLGLELHGREWARSVEHLDAALFDRADAERRAERAAAEIVAIRAERTELEADLRALRIEAAGLDDRIDEHEAALRQRALDLFVSFGDTSDLDALRSPGDAATDARVKQIAVEVDEAQLGLRRELRERRTTVVDELSQVARRVGALNTREAVQLALLDQAAIDRTVAVAAVDDATRAVRDARRRSDVVGLPMSLVALDAYLRAETALAAESPGCGIEWWMIAAVGRAESHHGELGGRTIEADGTVSTPIIGVALDGGPGVRAVVDTDDGALDTDAIWDRAVGPMQFIPETWSYRGRDGNGDGIIDPQNIYDAAYTTARYLCRLAGDLSTDAGREAAYFGYNTSDEYVTTVVGHGEQYRSFRLPPLPRESGDSESNDD